MRKFNYPLILLSIAYFITRLVNLSKLPIFTDEAIYSFWAQVALHDPSNRYISLEDGKQPLFIWLAAIAQKFISDPLIATRLISVFAGFGTLIGIYLLTETIINKKTALLASFLYLILPFSLLYDRMGLYDSLLTMLSFCCVFFSVKLAKNPKLDLAFLTGFVAGLGLITKSSANFFLYLLPVSLIFFDFKSKKLAQRLGKWLAFAATVFIIAQLIYNSLRLSPLFYMISRKNLDFIRPVSEVARHPFAQFYSNIHAMLNWIITYISLPLFILFIFALALAYFKKNLSLIYLSILVLVPFTAEALFNKVLYPRFMFFYLPYILILISYATFWTLDNFRKFENQLKVVFVLILIFPTVASYHILFDPPHAKIADSDADQYLNDWPSGYGVYQIRDFIDNKSKEQTIYVGTEGTFGLLPFALQIYFYGRENIHIMGFWPVDSQKLPQQILDLAKTNKTYFVFNENQKEIKNPNLKLIDRYQKGIGNTFMRLFEVTP